MSLLGQRLGKYRIISLLGVGGMAEVYVAEHELLQAKVAVKTLPPELARDQGMVERFMREARAAARLQHPHIIRIHDVGSEGSVHYFAMDLVDGVTLTQRIQSGGAQSDAEICRLSRQVLSALTEAHGHGLVHRDIKPDNIMLNQRDEAVVTDFGIAKAAREASLTSQGSFVGTMRYASPEQIQGQEVDGRSDLYSWGVVMYEMATGQVPFPGPDTASFVYQHLHELPQPPHELVPSLSPALSALILKALEKQPQDRFASAAEMLAALDRAMPGLAGRGASSRPSGEARARALLMQATAHAGQLRWTAARDLARQALELTPGLREAQELLQQTQAEAERDERVQNLTVEAQAYVNEGLYEQAGQIISELVGISRDKDAALAWLEEVLDLEKRASALRGELQKGQALEKGGNLQAARERYQALVQANPEFPAARQALERVENTLLAADLLEQARERTGQGDLRAAQDLCLQALRARPGNTQAKAALKEIQGRMSRAQRAQALLAQARLLLEHDDLAAAQNALVEAQQLCPDSDELRQLQEQAQALALSRPQDHSVDTKEQASPEATVMQASPPPAQAQASSAAAGLGSVEPASPDLASQGPVVNFPTSGEVHPSPPAPPPAKKRGGLWAGLGALCVLILAAGIWWGSRPASPPTTPAASPPSAPAQAAPDASALMPTPATESAIKPPAAPEQAKAEAELKAQQEAQAQRKAAEEAAKQEAALKAEQAAKAEQEAKEKADAEQKALEETQAKLEAKRRAAEEAAKKDVALKAEQEAKAKAASDKKAMELVERGEARAAAGHFEEAAKLWKQALSLSPGLALAEKKLAGLEERRREFSREQAETQSKRGSQISLTRGVDAFNAGDYDEAVKQLQMYLQAYPNDAMAKEHLAKAQEMQKGLKFGGLVVNCQPTAEVFIDGQSRGNTPLRLDSLAVGPHKVEVRAYGGRAEQSMDIKGRSTTTVRFQILGGSLSVNSLPWADISLDGKPVGQTPLSLDNLPLGSHSVTASHAGFRGVTQEVTLTHGQKAKLNFHLEPAQ